MGRVRERASPLLLLDGELHWRASSARIRARQSQASALEAIKYEPMATLAVGGSTLSEALASVEATWGGRRRERASPLILQVGERH